MEQRYITTLDIDGSERLVLTIEGTGSLNGSSLILQASDEANVYTARFNGRTIPVVMHSDGIRTVTVSMLGYSFTAVVLKEDHQRLHDILRRSPAMRSRVERISAPMPGLIKSVYVSNGSPIEKGMPLFTLEAMKMENAITAPISGTVGDVLVEAGSAVEKGVTLCQITPTVDPA